MKRKIIAGKEFCTYVKTPLIADDVHAYNVIWETGVADKTAGMVITAKRSDGVTVTDYAVTDEKGRGEYTLTGNMYSVTGTLEIRLSLVSETTTLTEKMLIFQVIEGSGNDKIQSEDNVPVFNTILAKTTEAIEKASNIPVKLSQLENDGNFVRDKDYVHTDNNFTNEHKDSISELEKEIDQTISKVTGIEEEIDVIASQMADFEDEVDEITVQITEITEELEETSLVAKGANQAISFDSYSAFVKHFNEITTNDMYNTGQNIMIVTVDVPDLWISQKSDEFKEYTYTTDEDFVKALNEKQIVQVGFYKFGQLETQKVNLEEYVKYDKTKEDTFNELSIWRRTSSFSYGIQFDDYERCVNWFNGTPTAPETKYSTNERTAVSSGQYISILDANLPDLIVIDENLHHFEKYEFKSNEEFMNDIKENGFVQVGEFKLRFAGIKNYNMSTDNAKREYELIKTIIITEDIQTANEDGSTIPLTYNLDDNGNPFKLDAFILDINCPEKPTYNGNWRCDVNEYPNFILSTPCNVGKNYKVHSERICNGYWNTVKAARFNDDMTSSSATLTFGATLENVDYATAFEFRLNSAPVGTTVTIYGRRVSE